MGTDINECETANNVCANGQCTDTEGGFCCDCDFGFVHGDDGTTCGQFNVIMLPNTC